MDCHFLFLLCALAGAAAEPISMIVGAATAFGLSFLGYKKFDAVKCLMYECCSEPWVRPNVSGAADIPSLRERLRLELFGQPLVVDTVANSLNAHLDDASPHKALVLSFHGTTGVGKTFVSSFIAKAVFKKGTESSFFHVITCSHVFPHKERVEQYKTELSGWIRGNVSACPRSVFVFDDLDKAQPEILDALRPFLDNHRQPANKAVFILISNTGGTDISEKTIDVWKEGRSRESVTLKEMEEIIHVAAFNTQGGLQFSDLITRHLVDHFVPFLPLERNQVELCIHAELRKKRGGVAAKVEEVASVMEKLHFSPKGLGKWSPSGCRQVPAKVNLFLEEERDKREASSHDEF